VQNGFANFNDAGDAITAPIFGHRHGVLPTYFRVRFETANCPLEQVP